MFITRWHLGHPWTHIAEKDFVLGRILNSPYVISTLPFVWLPLQPDLGLLGRFYVLGCGSNLHDFDNLLINRPPQTSFHTQSAWRSIDERIQVMG